MANNLETTLRRQVPTVPTALKALAAMERQLISAKTYDQIRRIIKEATALKILMDDVAEVKTAAEDAILMGNRRIAEELRKVPKAARGRKAVLLSREGKLNVGRGATGIKPTSRHRLGKLADKSTTELKATAKKLREQGKDATVMAVVREITQGDKKKRRNEREQALAKKIKALPDKKFGVILADPEWKFIPYSPNTGMDRAADNHYPTSELKEIMDRDVASIAAKDCVLFLCATAPMLWHAMQVMEAWGFEYKTNWELHKNRIITGYWNRNRHEHLLLGIRYGGKVPAPAQGEQWESVIEMTVGKHSAKPEAIHEMIEEYFPNLPKIELNRRGKPRDKWTAWGPEVELQEAAE